jgi:regulator of Ty1 transposition protein 109
VDSLLHHTDFGDADTSKTGSRKWIERVYLTSKELGETKDREEADWGEEIDGKVAVQATHSMDTTKTPSVNLLSARKKVKVDETPVNVLPVRKKAKVAGSDATVKTATAPVEVTDAPAEPAVTVLCGGLIRKKRKVEN